MNIIGQNIRKLRKAVGLTQIEFAKRIHLLKYPAACCGEFH